MSTWNDRIRTMTGIGVTFLSPRRPVDGEAPEEFSSTEPGREATRSRVTRARAILLLILLAVPATTVFAYSRLKVALSIALG